MLRSTWSFENKSISNELLDWGGYKTLDKGVGDMDHLGRDPVGGAQRHPPLESAPDR